MALNFDKLVVIQYPSGSFGHFIHLLLTKHGKDFSRIDHELNFNTKFKSGSSHHAEDAVQAYYSKQRYEPYAKDRLQLDYAAATENNKLTTVLVNSSINNDSQEYRDFFPGATRHIRVCYDDFSWPFSAKLLYTRCMAEVYERETSIEEFIFPADEWESAEDWTKVEKYFLFLRDHYFRYAWKKFPLSFNIDSTIFLNYDDLFNCLSSQFRMESFENTYEKFYELNEHHFTSFLTAKKIFNALLDNKELDLNDARSDLFTRATVNYFIQAYYGFEIPAWDYRNWFYSTRDIFTMFDRHNINYSIINQERKSNGS